MCDTYIFYCVFFLILRRQLRSTLFPYTTLFRSIGGNRCCSDACADCAFGLPAVCTACAPGQYLSGGVCKPCASGCLTCTDGDRKSTRLNSSHLVISYAVFCLKKKNKRYYNSSNA